MTFDVYVLLDWSEGDETSTILGVYFTLGLAQAARPNATWRFEPSWKRNSRVYPDTWKSGYSTYSIEKYELQGVIELAASGLPEETIAELERIVAALP